MKNVTTGNDAHVAAHSVSDLPTGLAQPAQRALAGAGITQLEQLTRLSETEIRQLHGIGPKALDKLRTALGEMGLSFAAERSGNQG